jgi:LysM repeat protein
MDWRRMLMFIAINVIVSTIVVLVILSIWESRQPALATLPAFNTAPQSTTAPLDTEAPIGDTATPPPTTVALAPSPTPTPSGPFTYQIQAGDTLGRLALEFDIALEDLLQANNLTEDDVLSIGQEIIIPVGGVTPLSTTSELTSTIAAQTGGHIAFPVVREIISPGQLTDEVLVLSNIGETAVSLLGWTLSDGNNHRFVFPDFRLEPSSEINIHTRTGVNTPFDLYWGESAARWGASGTVAYLRDASGKLVATYRVP